MNSSQLETRFRHFLLVVAASLCVGTVLELIFSEHFESPAQFIPFVLCGVGLLAILIALFFPRRGTIWGLRLTMLLVGLGSLFGIFEHVEHNFAFELEIRPNAVAGDVLWDALQGANPLLAPGILGLTALLALAATYYHPRLNGKM
ncbi:MAG: hypothetical protein KDE59_16360 [Anaerolineales bacterium]|nr:hypothetical protein [Anaerolineales bacterium]